MDAILSQKTSISKSQIAKKIKLGLVKHNGLVCEKCGLALREGDVIECIEEQEEAKLKREFEGRVEVLFEDEDVLVLNKPPHLVVHEGCGDVGESLVDYLKRQGKSLSTLGGEHRAGIVHRLDKPTTGAILVAKNDFSHAQLSDQIRNREVGRYYLAITDLPLKSNIEVECLMGRHPKNRLKMAKRSEGRYSRSVFAPLLSGRFGLVAAKLYTGRTHQIRLHLETLGRHIIGDELYGKKDTFGMRLMLHAYMLYFTHPRTHKRHRLCAPLFEDMLGLLANSFDVEMVDEVVSEGGILRSFGDDF